MLLQASSSASSGGPSAVPKPVFEKARSGRAKCRCCSEQIQNSSCRLGSPVWYARRQTFTNYWFHIGCIRLVASTHDCCFCSSPSTHRFYMPDITHCGTNENNSYFCFHCFGKKTRTSTSSVERGMIENKINLSTVLQPLFKQNYLARLRAGWGVTSASSASRWSSSGSSAWQRWRRCWGARGRA